jgi:steroid delta-isomerase-like uncharacterized protein
MTKSATGEANAIPNPASESDLKARRQRTDDNLRMVHAYFDALFTKDLKTMLDMFNQDIEWLIVPTGDRIEGKDKIATVAANQWVASPDRIKTLVNIFASEDFACLEFRTAGMLTKQADFSSITPQPTGKKNKFLCCLVFHIKNGKIDRVREYFDMQTVGRQLGNVGTGPETNVARLVAQALTSDDIESVVDLFAPDGEWVIMATGETFLGHDQIRELATRSVTERNHPAGPGIKPINISTSPQGTKLSWEYPEWGVFQYMKRGAITKELSTIAATSGSESPIDPNALVGRPYEVPVCFVYHVNARGKIYLLHEYLDLGSLMKCLK